MARLLTEGALPRTMIRIDLEAPRSGMVVPGLLISRKKYLLRL